MDEPKIEFPCEYPVKVIVEIGSGVMTRIVTIVQVHDSRIEPHHVTENPSRNGRYVSLRFILWATGKPQLEALFVDLKKCDAVRMVL